MPLIPTQQISVSHEDYSFSSQTPSSVWDPFCLLCPHNLNHAIYYFLFHWSDRLRNTVNRIRIPQYSCHELCLVITVYISTLDTFNRSAWLSTSGYSGIVRYRLFLKLVGVVYSIIIEIKKHLSQSLTTV